ncbi:beta-lactamase regulating signal transducer with metallopeptidase domain [Paenibacillus sp. DS2015]|uniref:hypothetical protein n=1 Tax=Paenibacillus sp. DS2015 TaxID=3373917 RepID=UPI003D211F98
MTFSNVLVLIAVVLILFFILNEMINYIARRDHEDPPSYYNKLWLIPVISILIIIPLIGFTFIYGMFFYSFGMMTDFLSFDYLGDVFTFSLIVLLGFIFLETFVHPIVIALLRYGLKRKVSVYTKYAITIIVDSITIYFLSNMFNGVYVKDFLSALSISVIYHIIEWILIGFYWFYKKINKNSDD